jgi:type IV pilus assembly protein PilN
MILINLLPHREEARKRRRDNFYAMLGAAALIGGLIAGAVFLYYQAQLSNQAVRNNFLKGEISRLENQIKEIANLQAEIAALKARQQAVEDLQADRNIPVNLLNEFVAQLPDGVFINRLSQRTALSIEFSGMAQSEESVTQLLRNFNGVSAWITSPELIEIKAGSFQLSQKDTKPVKEFQMRAALKRPDAPKPAASGAAPAASGAAPAASAAKT